MHDEMHDEMQDVRRRKTKRKREKKYTSENFIQRKEDKIVNFNKIAIQSNEIRRIFGQFLQMERKNIFKKPIKRRFFEKST